MFHNFYIAELDSHLLYKDGTKSILKLILIPQTKIGKMIITSEYETIKPEEIDKHVTAELERISSQLKKGDKLYGIKRISDGTGALLWNDLQETLPINYFIIMVNDVPHVLVRSSINILPTTELHNFTE